MRLLNIWILFLLFSTSAFCQHDSVIYNMIIEEYVLNLRQPNIDYSSNTTITVLKSPRYLSQLTNEDFPRFKEKYDKLNKQTFYGFVKNIQDDLHLDMHKFTDIDVVLIDKDSIPKRIDLINLYPAWIHSMIEFSNIGYNDNRDQALVYYGFDSGPGVSGGIYLIFERKRNKWKIKKVIPSWAA